MASASLRLNNRSQVAVKQSALSKRKPAKRLVSHPLLSPTLKKSNQKLPLLVTLQPAI